MGSDAAVTRHQVCGIELDGNMDADTGGEGGVADCQSGGLEPGDHLSQFCSGPGHFRESWWHQRRIHEGTSRPLLLPILHCHVPSPPQTPASDGTQQRKWAPPPPIKPLFHISSFNQPPLPTPLLPPNHLFLICPQGYRLHVTMVSTRGTGWLHVLPVRAAQMGPFTCTPSCVRCSTFLLECYGHIGAPCDLPMLHTRRFTSLRKYIACFYGVPANCQLHTVQHV